MTLVPRYECDQIYYANFGHRLTENQMCATGASNICKGDSGGPVMCRNKANGMSLIGLISGGGTPCGGVPAIFSRTCVALNWINTIISQNV